MMRAITFVIFSLTLFSCHTKQSENTVSIETGPRADSVNTVNNLTDDEIQAITYCEFDNLHLNFDSVLDVKTAKQLLKKDPSIEYYLQNESFHVFQIVKQDILARKPLAKKLGLSSQALIVEQQTILGYPNRAFILWVDSGRVGFESEPYSCPSVTMGKGFFQGRARVSLIDIKNQKIINTIPIYGASWEGIRDCFTIPFCIANPKYKSELGQLKYHALGGDSIKDGRADVLYLDDYNGDGKKHEFALYEQMGCISCFSTLFGYNEKADSLINYTVVLEETDLDSALSKPYTTASTWVSQLFTLKPKKGIYDFVMNYRGRGGNLCYYNIAFSKENNRFEGTLKFTAQENDTMGMSWITYPIQR
ncbi:MAG: hypothetical protein F9K23_10690 [Bacteroidetes bacterium]|nr:MAG: hypothetical protein F9K23_10690 [Bacteroidota bacterium]